MNKQFILVLLIGILGLILNGCGETDSYKTMKEDAKNWENPNNDNSNSSFKFPTLLRKNTNMDEQDPRTKILKSLSVERGKGVNIDGVFKKDKRDLSDLINSDLSDMLNETVLYQQNNDKEVSWADGGMENFYALKQITNQILTNRDTQFKLLFKFGDDLDLDNYMQEYLPSYLEKLSNEKKIEYFNDEYQNNLVCGVSNIFSLKKPFYYDQKLIDKGFILTCGNFFKMN